MATITQKIILMFALMLCTVSSSYAALTNLPLNHQSPNQIIHTIKPVLPSDVLVSPGSQSIIINAPADKLNEIKSLIKSLDKPSIRLLISVKVSHDVNPLNGAQVKRVSTLKYNEQQRFRSISVLSGGTVFIQHDNVASVLREVNLNAGCGAQCRGIGAGFDDYHLPSGIVLKAELVGDNVRIRYQQIESGRSLQGAFEHSQSSSVTEIPLGEWRMLNAQQAYDPSESGAQHVYAGLAVDKQQQVLIKIDRLGEEGS